ncbi:MAG: ABC transporter ATP-binding protein [Planctomycetes bacterium]|nr:ABC transporter ATP-binding protein [Planctomycetota bacterium]
MTEVELTRRQQRKRIHQRWKRILRTFWPFSERHRGSFWKSTVAALGVVGLRLALPWPIRSLLGPWLSGEGQVEATWMNNPWTIGALLLLIVVGLGLFEFRQRVYVARFAIAWVRDIRAEAFFAANKVDPRSLQTTSGDLVARLVGDTARLKAGLKGTLTHVVTNGIFFLGVGVLMLWISPLLGAIFLVAGASIFWVTLRGAEILYLHYLKLRKKEGKLATRIEQAVYEGEQKASFTKVNYSSGLHETNVVRIQGRTTLASHALLGIATFFALIVGFEQLESNAIDPGKMLIVFIYMIELHRPMVRLCRQGTRFGKMAACGNRLERIIRAASESKYLLTDLEPLKKKIRFKSVVVAGTDRNRLGPISLEMRTGQIIALQGPAGAGKTTLLEMLIGRAPLTDGKVLWDKQRLSKISLSDLGGRIGFLSCNPQWPRQSFRALLGLKKGEFANAEYLAVTGAKKVIDRFTEGLDSEVNSQELSRRQVANLAMAQMLHQKKDVMLLDDPLKIWPLDQFQRILAALSRPNNLVLFTCAAQDPMPQGVRIVLLQDGLLDAPSLNDESEIEPCDL